MGLFSDSRQELLQNPAKRHGFSVGDVEYPAGSPRSLHGQFTGQSHILHTGDVHQVPSLSKKGNARLLVGSQESGHQTGIPDADKPPRPQDNGLQAFAVPPADHPFRHQFGFDVIVQIVLLGSLVFPDAVLVFLSRVYTGGRHIDQTPDAFLQAQSRHKICTRHIGSIEIFPFPPNSGKRACMDYIIHSLKISSAAFSVGKIPRTKHSSVCRKLPAPLPVPPQCTHPVCLHQTPHQVFPQKAGGPCYQNCLSSCQFLCISCFLCFFHMVHLRSVRYLSPGLIRNLQLRHT